MRTAQERRKREAHVQMVAEDAADEDEEVLKNGCTHSPAALAISKAMNEPDGV